MLDSLIETLIIVGCGFFLLGLLYVWNLYWSNKEACALVEKLRDENNSLKEKNIVLSEEIKKLGDLKGETPFPEIYIEVKPNSEGTDDIVFVNLDWPKDCSEDKVYDVYTKLLYLMQSGHLYHVFDEALADKCKKEGFGGLRDDINTGIQSYIDNDKLVMLSNVNGQLPIGNMDSEALILPSEVFRGGRDNGNS